jgi:hypothetical protein
VCTFSAMRVRLRTSPPRSAHTHARIALRVLARPRRRAHTHPCRRCRRGKMPSSPSHCPKSSSASGVRAAGGLGRRARPRMPSWAAPVRAPARRLSARRVPWTRRSAVRARQRRVQPRGRNSTRALARCPCGGCEFRCGAAAVARSRQRRRARRGHGPGDGAVVRACAPSRRPAWRFCGQKCLPVKSAPHPPVYAGRRATRPLTSAQPRCRASLRWDSRQSRRDRKTRALYVLPAATRLGCVSQHPAESPSAPCSPEPRCASSLLTPHPTAHTAPPEPPRPRRAHALASIHPARRVRTHARRTPSITTGAANPTRPAFPIPE